MNYFYETWVEMPNGTTKERSGVVAGDNVLLAMNVVDEYVKGWKAKLLRVKLSQMNSDGELRLELQTTNSPSPSVTRVTPKVPNPFIFGGVVTAPTFVTKKLEDT